MTAWMIIKSYYIEELKIRHAKYEIDLLKVYDEDNNYHYVLVKNKCRLLNVRTVATLIKSFTTTIA